MPRRAEAEMREIYDILFFGYRQFKYAAQKLQEAFWREMINIAEAVRKERFLLRDSAG